MSAQVPPEYCVELFTLNTYVPTVKLRFGHDVPDTSVPTVIGVVVVTPLSGTNCSGVTIDRPGDVAATLDGAVVTTDRSLPHPTSGSAPSATAPTVNAVRRFLMTPGRVHRACQSSAIRLLPSTNVLSSIYEDLAKII